MLHIISNPEVRDWTENYKTPRLLFESLHIGNWSSSLANNMIKYNADLSELLSFDKTITWKLNWAVFFRQQQPSFLQNRIEYV